MPVSRMVPCSPGRSRSIATPLSLSSRATSCATRSASACTGLQRQDCAPLPVGIMLEREADLGPRHREAAHHIEAGGVFAARRAQELAPRRHPGEQLFDPHPRARRQCGWSFGRHAPRDRPRAASPARHRGTRLSSVSRATLAIDGSASPRKPSVATCSIAASSPIRFRAASKWHAVRAPAPCRRASSRSRRRSLRCAPARPRPALTAIRVAPGVDRVFDQFLERRRRPLDHFARGDAVDERFGQAADRAASGPLTLASDRMAEFRAERVDFTGTAWHKFLAFARCSR